MDADKKNRVLEFAENHPYVLLFAIGVLLILIVIMYFNGCRIGVGPMGGRKKSKRKPLDDEEEMDELIMEIHAAQRRKSCAQ